MGKTINFYETKGAFVKFQQKLALTQVAAAATLAAFQMGAAFAQTDTTATSGGALNLDEVVVTAAPTGRSKMKSTDSVSTLSDTQITQSGATNTADILRDLPGVRSEASGGNGNANISVRGLPLSAGGSRYVQLQEDGLPVLLWGDASFATPDEFMRTDYATSHVEFVRGGQAATAASNAPGAVINFITKNGKEESNDVGYTYGLGTRLNRLDFNYGTAVGKDSYINIGGFERTGGGGAINTTFNSENGGQIRANFLHELDKGGFIQFNVKHLNDSTPTLLPVPVSIKGGTVTTLPGIDPRTYYPINSGAMSRDTTMNSGGSSVTSSATNGLQIQSDSVGIGARFALENDWIINENFRRTSNSGRFVGAYPQNNATAAGAPAGTTPYTLFNSSLDDLGNVFNDVKISKTFKLENGSTVSPTVGVFTGQQNLGETWYWNTYNVTTAGVASFGNGAIGSNGTWGGCCVKTYSVNYVENDPYANVHYENGALTVDGGVRQQNQSVSGTTTANNPAVTTGLGAWGAPSLVNYSLNQTNYSLGANYAIHKDLSVYASTSQGANFTPLDRMVGAVDGTTPASYNKVTQYDFGVRSRQGAFNVAATVFYAQTKEYNYDLTTQQTTANAYTSKGIELEAGYRSGGFRVTGSTTYTDSHLTDSLSTANIGNTPQRQAQFIYSVIPSYEIGRLTLGGSMIGTTSSAGDDANTTTMPGYTVFNAFASYGFSDRLLGSISVNNLFDTLAYTEFDNVGAGTASAARALPGRTIYATLKYKF